MRKQFYDTDELDDREAARERDQRRQTERKLKQASVAQYTALPKLTPTVVNGRRA